MDLVDDVDLPAPWCRERRPGNEVSHGLNSVIRGCVELMDVERGTTGDVDTGVAQPAGLAVHRARAVESLGKDPRRRCLTRPPRPGEKVGVGDMVVTNGVPQGTDYVVLATDLVEPLRTITPVERLVIIHPASRRLVGQAIGQPRAPAAARHSPHLDAVRSVVSQSASTAGAGACAAARSPAAHKRIR